MLKSIFSFMLIGTLLFSSIPIENIGGNKATADEVSQSVVTLDEVFVSENGILADGKSGDYVGIPSQAFEPRQAFDNVTVDAERERFPKRSLPARGRQCICLPQQARAVRKSK